MTCHDDVIKWKHYPRYWPLCGEFTGHWRIPCTKASEGELWWFFYLRLYKRSSKHSWGWWFETPSCPLWRHCNVHILYFSRGSREKTKPPNMGASGRGVRDFNGNPDGLLADQLLQWLQLAGPSFQLPSLFYGVWVRVPLWKWWVMVLRGVFLNYTVSSCIKICVFYGNWKLFADFRVYSRNMTTSSNGNIFRVTGPLCREITGHRWIPLTKASDAELWCFLWSARINAWVNHRDAGDFRRHRAHYDVIVMNFE